ncbi:MAG: flagellar hook assembly protein FlgD [Comamonadaceae bacterium]|nr:MAG: flagellar hook assembly protein FlgD [Comamonadaceae bacterium]
MVTATTPIGTAAPAKSYDISQGSDSNAIAAANSTEAQDRFLKLLVAQLSNQDPMNPMDNAQMTSQIAQINTVTGIQQLNDTMKSMATQMSAMQVLQAGNLVGHGVLSEGNQLAFDATAKTAVGALELAGAASSVKVEVVTAGGTVVDTLALGALKAGQHGFTVDTSKYPSNTPLSFRVNALNGKEAVVATPLMRDTVVGVGSDATGLTLNLLGGGSTPYAKVRSVL